MNEGNNTNDLPDVNNPPTEQETTVQKVDETAVLNFLKEQGREVNSIDDLFKEPERVIETKEVNPFEDLMDEEDKAYFQYKKETGRSRSDYEKLNTNLDEVSPIEFAREQVLKEAGMKLSNDQINDYLQNKLGIEDMDNLTTNDMIELAKYGKSMKDARLEEQAKYKQPILKPEVSQNQNTNQNDYVQLANGTFMKKSDFDVAQQNQIKHNQMVQEAVNSVTATSFKVMIDENGEQKELNFDYNYSDNDRSSAVSMVTDLGKYVQESYQSEQGFNHKQFAEDVFWLNPKNRETVMTSLIHKARAEAIEEVMKQRGNVNYQNQSNNLSNTEKPRTKIVNINDI